MTRLPLGLVLAALVAAFAQPAIAARPPAHRVDLTRAQQEGSSHRELAAPARDVTGDGRADAVVRDPGADAGSFRLYTHDGSAAPWTSYVSLSGAWDFADVLQVGDVDGDGRPDLVARDPSAGNGTLWIYPNNGAASGNPWTSRVSAGTGWNFADTILLGDLTGDGRPDLAVREPGVLNGSLWIYPHSGAATGNPWTGPRARADTGWNLADAMMMADVNGDGHRDMVVRDHGGVLWVYPHSGVRNGNPFTVPRYAGGTGWNIADALGIGDATGDGRPDMLARTATGDLWIYPHDGRTDSANPWTLPRRSAGGGWDFANALVLVDVSGDGRLDILARVHAGDMWVYPNNGSTTGSPWTARFSAGTRWRFENQLLLGDVTGDGRPDMLARDPGVADGTLWVYPHDGSTAGDPWTLPRELADTGWNLATAMMLGDITGDGWADIVARDRNGDLWVYPHDGSSTGRRWTIARGWAGAGWNTATALALADVNLDGTPDLVDLERDGALWVYVTGSSGPPVRIEGDWSEVAGIATGDVHGTGRPDLVARERSGALWIHPHTGATSGNPWRGRVFAGGGWSFASALLL